jgi:hypothetical protein
MIAGPIRVISNATLTGAGTAPTVTGIVPCYGARQVDFKITAATGANMSAEASVNVSDNGTNMLSGSGQGVSVRNGSANGINPATTPCNVTFAPASGLTFGYRYLQITITGANSGGQNITGLNVDAYVVSDDEVAGNVAQPLP